MALGEHAQRLLEQALRGSRPGRERARGERALGIGHEQRRVDLVARADAAALGARAVRIVEREHARRHLRKRDAAVRAREALGEHERRPVDHVDLHDALGELQRRLERVGEAAAERVLHHEAVDDDLDRVLLRLRELDLLAELAELAVDADPRIALAAQVEEQLPVLALAAAHDRREQRDAAARRGAS